MSFHFLHGKDVQVHGPDPIGQLVPLGLRLGLDEPLRVEIHLTMDVTPRFRQTLTQLMRSCSRRCVSFCRESFPPENNGSLRHGVVTPRSRGEFMVV
jgi:hypothetical protein